jgi:predicted CXXCH cytochrome family protein
VGDIAWWNGGPPAAPLDNTLHGQGDPFNVGFGGAMAGNHPVAMPYPYQQSPSTYNGVTTGAGFVSTEWQTDPTANNIRLFNDSAGDIAAGAVAGVTGIECSSCHDPHNKASVDDFFLRGNLTGNDTNYICLKCHIK